MVLRIFLSVCVHLKLSYYLTVFFSQLLSLLAKDGRPGSKPDGGSSSTGSVTPGGSSSSSGGGSGAACQISCLNGGTCINNKCICRVGYQGEYCGERNKILCAIKLV